MRKCIAYTDSEAVMLWLYIYRSWVSAFQHYQYFDNNLESTLSENGMLAYTSIMKTCSSREKDEYF